MTPPPITPARDSLPNLGLLALAALLVVYLLNQFETCRPPLLCTGGVLFTGGLLLLLLGVRSQQSGRNYAAAALLPLGLFWLSLISYEVFPEFGLGRHPDGITMFAYLSLWGMFMAVLFLGSFRQNPVVQALYGTMMFSFLALAMDHLRNDQVFLALGSLTGLGAGCVALYLALAQYLEERCGFPVLPLGSGCCAAEEKDRDGS